MLFEKTGGVGMIKSLGDIKENNFKLVGGKAYNLSKMLHYGIHIPNGFVVTTEAYDAYIRDNQLQQKLTHILNSKISSGEKSQQIKALFNIEGLPAEIKESIITEYKKLSSKSVAVRSSSTAEDLPGMSFAGQYNSYLNVGEKDLIEKVVLCWQSLWNERAIEYRAKHNIETDFSHGVVIQEMVNSKISGVIFTANPVNGVRNEILINASYGLGEAIVSGEVHPDQYIVDKTNANVIKEEIASKEKACHCSENGVKYMPVPEGKKLEASLKDIHIKAIVEESTRIQNYFGQPQDIEFAFNDKDELFILQSREITTLFPIDDFLQDGKLRAYLSAGTVLLGMKEPFTPLGFELFSGMFPTIINTMTMQKKPIDNSFVKYAGCRLYVDITYLLSSNFVAKQFAIAFSDNDLPLKDVMLGVVEKHGRSFTSQGIRFKLPWGAFRYMVSMIGGFVEARRVPKDKRYDAMIQAGEEIYRRRLKQSEGLKSLEEKIDFSFNCLVDGFLLTQTEGLYATDMVLVKGINNTVNKMYGSRFNMEQLIYSLPRCITQELAIKLNLAAKYFDANNIEPSAGDPKIKKIIEKYGCRGNIELDFGTPRWSEDPAFIINQVKSYMVDGMYERNLADIVENEKRAEALIEDIYQAVKRDRGRRKAVRLKNKMIAYRIAAGMREYPKYDIVRLMSIARNVMLDIGAELVQEGLIEDKQDIFFLFKKDILKKEYLKSKVEINKGNYQKEMSRRSIPRIVLNTGETYYSALRIDPKSTVIQGMPLSPGVYEGTIRIVSDLQNSSLKEGEIMVTESTNPAWTPLFAIAKGLIMEYGGPASHGGIVAREYGIPAVVGITSATSIFKDGQIVRINGETGIIEINK